MLLTKGPAHRRFVRGLAALLIPAVMLILAPGPAHGQDGDLPPAARLSGLRHEFQTWNNCGPVNLTMVLSYYGWGYDQTVAAGWLKPSVEDRNVSPSELAEFVNRQQTALPHLRAVWRYGGTLELVKALIATGFPVILETGFQPEGLEWMGHYQTIVAYDDAASQVWIYDSYHGLGDGSGMVARYAEIDAWWQHFNRVYVIVYPEDRQAEVDALLGPAADFTAAAAQALDTAQHEAAADPDNAFAWFNVGTSAAALGEWPIAVTAYDQALRLGLPFRMLWYQFGPYQAYHSSGRYFDVLRLADETAATTEHVEETYYWRGLAYAALGRIDEALAQLQIARSLNPRATAAAAYDLVASGHYTPPAPLRIAPAAYLP